MGAVQVLGGRYELGDAIGHGASTETFRARDTARDRVVAVRLPRDRRASDPDDRHGDRDKRYDDPAALKDALSGTPEWHQVTTGPAPRPG
jgi:hypothetical protein